MDTIAQGKIRRDKILRFLKYFLEKYGYSPSIREIGEAVGLSSNSTVHVHLEHLRVEGKISWNPKIPRTIRILEK